MAGLIAMISVFTVVSIEMFFSTMNGGAMGGCHGGGPAGYESLTPVTPHFGHRRGGSSASATSFKHGRTLPVETIGGGGGLGRPTQRTRRSSSISHQLQRIEIKVMDTSELPDAFSGGSESSIDTRQYRSDDTDEDGDSDAGEDTELRSLNRRKRSLNASQNRRLPIISRLTEEQQQKKNLLQVMLLEAGILFHSVFIGTHPPSLPPLHVASCFTYNWTGMALSVATGSNFIVLLIAITFHREYFFWMLLLVRPC